MDLKISETFEEKYPCLMSLPVRRENNCVVLIFFAILLMQFTVSTDTAVKHTS